jgi:hypothetical protein
MAVAAPSASIFINSSGPATGQYIADKYFVGGSTWNWSGSQPGIYNTERWSTASFGYAIPVTPGPVQVTLKLRESCVPCAYVRKFNVTAEGQSVFTGVTVPGNTVVDKVFTVTSDATLNLTFTAANTEAWVNGIEVRQLSSTPAAPTVTLSAGPANIGSGGSSTLTWSSTNATGCTASGGWTGTQATSGSVSTGALTASTTYTLSCTGAGGSASQSVVVTVGPRVTTVALSANPQTITAGDSSMLTWSSTNATSCTASDGWSGAWQPSGSVSTGPLTATTSFSLSCSGASTDGQTVTVAVNPPPAPTLTFNASPTTVTMGGSSTLSWSTTNVTGCTASGGWSGAQLTSGSASSGPLTATTSFALSCTGAGGSLSSTATVTATSAAAIFPLHIEAGKRYLIDAQGHPFHMQGDSPWDLVAQLTDSEIEMYLNDRQARGFDAVLVELMEHMNWSPLSHAPNNAYGDPPFNTPGDFATPNEAYMAHLEAMLQKARDRGIVVLLTPAYMGDGGGSQGWYAEMQANGPAKLRAFGQYLATRFRSYDNIIWVHGGDFTPPENDLMRAIAEGIRDVDTKWLHTFHGDRQTSALGFLGTSEPWLSLNDIYTDAETVTGNAFAEYNRSTMPFFLIEDEYESNTGNGHLVRLQAYQAMLSGATGHLMGNDPVWYFGPGWQTYLDSYGARTVGKMRALYEARSWWLLQPDTGNTLLTAGAGSGSTRAVASLASDRSFALLYTPDIRALTVSLAQLAGPHVSARWYDPANGTYTTVTGSPFTASSSRVFNPGSTNSDAESDWVLVLESVP